MASIDPYLYSNSFEDYELIDSGGNKRLERWGSVRLVRPDPQAIWNPGKTPDAWVSADATFISSSGEDTGRWKVEREFPHPWTVLYQNTRFELDLTPFKHTGIFPEQAVHWEWALPKFAKASQRPQILNLFAYTGATTVLFAKAGGFVTHVDASRPSIAWAKRNQAINNLESDTVRWILDDAVKFVKRELKRGKKYDGIILDPPAYGHGPAGQIWKFSQHLPGLLADCRKLLADKALFFILNAYATNSSALALQNLMRDHFPTGSGKVLAGELCLKDGSDRLVSTGIFARWEPHSG